MVIWSGAGGLVILIVVACSILVPSLLGQPSSRIEGWSGVLSMFVSAVLVTLLGWFLNKRPGRVVIDKATGQEITLKSKDTVFFIPVIYWGAILAGLGIYLLIAK